MRLHNRKYRLHLLGFAHLPISEEYNSCAYTQKVVKFSKMMLSLGHEVYLYGAEGSNAPCTEFIQTHTLKDIRSAWGDKGSSRGIGYDWKATFGFRSKLETQRQKNVYTKLINNCIKEINKRKRPDDFLCLTQGVYHKEVAEKVKLLLTVETGIGYRKSFARFRAFESAFIQNFTYGYEIGNSDMGNTGKGNFYDRVIPNYFDPTHFDNTQKKEPYMLYLGRLVGSKGILIAVRLAKELRVRLKIAGQGSIDNIPITKEEQRFVEFVGYADIESRKQLMAKSTCFVYPTLYREPFGGAVIEAMLSGTPVLTTEFGAFPEIVHQGVTGYRCDTFQDFVDAGKIIMSGQFTKQLQRAMVRKLAERYLMDNVRWQYQKWFDELYGLYENTVAVYSKITRGETPREIKNEVWYRLRS